MAAEMANTPADAWFAPPEGVYTLVQSINVTSSATSHFVSNVTMGPPAPTAMLNAMNANEQQAQLPPPMHPTRMAVISVQFPPTAGPSGAASSAAIGNGLSMSMPGLRSNGHSTNGTASRKDSAPVDGVSVPGHVATAGTSGTGVDGGSIEAVLGDASKGNSSSQPSPSLDRHGSFSPLMKRKPLASSFSIPTLGSLGGTGEGASGTSRPQRQFRGTSSSFVRSWEGLPLGTQQFRNIQEGNPGKNVVFGFWTQSRSVVWSEIMPSRPKEALARVIFSAVPTCVDVNQHTASHNQLDVLVGFASGDIFWFDPFAGRYTRLNKGGVITSSAVTAIMWLPPSPNYSTNENHSNLFLTAHADGTMLVWDKDREDLSGFTPTPVSSNSLAARHPVTPGKENEPAASFDFDGPAFSGDVSDLKSSHGSRSMGDIIVSRPQVVDKRGQGTATKYNPVSHWRVSRRAITAFAFSPDLQLCAAVSEDGCLRIINAVEERLLDTFQSYFGSLTCVSWSPDGRFVVTGGQDDLCTVYAPLEQRLVAQCEGHSSWVSGVAWDPWRSDDRTMRFASVGEDCKLILWDLSSAALTRPKSHAHHGPRRQSISSQRDSMFHLPLSSAERSDPLYHPAPRRDDVATLQPIMVKNLSTDLFANLYFLPDYLITLSRAGQIKSFDRPPDEEAGLLGLRSEFRSSVVALDRRAR